MKRTAAIFGSFVAVLGVLFLYIRHSNRPPKEIKLIDNFSTHRATFERLRDMLLEDKHVLAVARWGVETTSSGPHHVQPGGDFPIDRYNEYLALLAQSGGKRVFRIRGKAELIGITVWATGWGGDTRHIDIYWTEQNPPNQVDSLEHYYQTPKPRSPIFRRIDEDWYLWADW
jgi:hypothetical protein